MTEGKPIMSWYITKLILNGTGKMIIPVIIAVWNQMVIDFII